MYFPSRGGVRGGQDQFNWEDIKTDKFRENYLGHSVKAPVGRWQKGKDLAWYSKGSKNDAQSRSETIAALKRVEAEALSAALGHRPVKKDNHQLSKDELAEALKRGQVERSGLEIDRIEGMGYSGVRAGVAPKGGMNFQMMVEQVVSDESDDQTPISLKNTADSATASFKAKKDDQRKSPKRKKKSKKRKSTKQCQTSSGDEVSSSVGSSKEYEKDDKSSRTQAKVINKKARSR
uniref:Multiple myeloma tumor-associated protein 2-like N-terminal domain-containing protein n=1 Tax=Strigamia maritima TaxID=126957 RepID=T1JCM7_STRMM